MNTFLLTLIIFVLLVGTSAVTYIIAKREILKTLKESILKAKKKGKKVLIITDGIKISIDPKDFQIEVLAWTKSYLSYFFCRWE